MKIIYLFPLFLFVLLCGTFAHSRSETDLNLNLDKTPADREFFFKPEDNGVRISNGQLSWKFEDSETVLIGDRRISGAKISAQMMQTPRVSTPAEFQKSDSTSKDVFSLGFSWPDEIVRSGKILIMDSEEKEIASWPVTVDDRSRWSRILEKDKEKFLKNLSPSTYGILDLDPSIVEALRESKHFSVCLLATGQQSETFRACTSTLQFSNSENDKSQLHLKKQGATIEPTVFVNDINATDTGVVNFSDLKKIGLKLRFGSGNTIALSLAPRPIEFLDIVEAKNQKKFHIIGRGTVPLSKVKMLEPKATGLWISDREKQTLWKLEISKSSPLIKLNASWGLVLTFVIDFEELPSEADRMAISNQVFKSTYSQNPLMHLSVNAENKVTTLDGEISESVENKPIWKFPAPKLGEFNTARVQIQKKNAKPEDPVWTASHELFRAYQGEFQALIGPGMVSTTRFFAVGEVNASYWLNSVAGLDSETFSNLRWGGTVSYLRFLTPLSVESSLSTDGSGEEVLSPIGVLDVSLKYNLIPGAWNQDELMGLILSFENQSLRAYSANLLGVGAYWARKLPHFFDVILNKLPLLKEYKKYVDMQFVYYPMALGNRDQTRINYELNLHGKFFWTSRLYGQMGFGLKQIQFTKDAGAVLETQINLRSSYGTLGLGYLF